MALIVTIGPGDADGIPAAAIDRLAREARAVALSLSADVMNRLGLEERLSDRAEVREALTREPDLAVAAADPDAHRLALEHPGASTWPDREALRARAIGAEVAELVTVGARLRRDCPWDRVQTAQTIVPHTIEEAFEVAEAVASGVGLPDELGDLLFQSVFLAQMLEEDGEADLASIARGQIDKLIGRHPHVYGDRAAADAAAVVDLWEHRKRTERADQGIFHDLPTGLPALAYATKAQKRAAVVELSPLGRERALEHLEREVARLRDEPGERELGDAFFALVAVARALRIDPELSLRASARRFRDRVERAAVLAEAAGEPFEGLDAAARLGWCSQAAREEASR